MSAGLDASLTHRLGPIEPVLSRLDPLLQAPIELTPDEFRNLVAFVGEGLLDQRVRKQNLCNLVPSHVPGGMPTMRFEGCPQRKQD